MCHKECTVCGTSAVSLETEVKCNTSHSLYRCISIIAFLPCPKIVAPNMECGMPNLAALMVWCVCVMVLHTTTWWCLSTS